MDPEQLSMSSQEELQKTSKKESKGLLSRITKELEKYPCLKPKSIILYIFTILYFTYIGYAIYYITSNDLPWLWCQGLGFILILTGMSVVWVACKLLYGIPPLKRQTDSLFDRIGVLITSACSHLPVQILLHCLVYGGILTYLVVDAWDESERLISVVGIVVLLSLAISLSKHRRHIHWRLVTWGIFLQFCFALICLRWDFGRSAINCISKKVEDFLAYTEFGGAIAYEYLVTRKPFILAYLDNGTTAYEVAKEINDRQAVPGITVFTALPVVFFFCFILNMLFYLGVVQAFTANVGKLIEMTMGSTVCESTNAAANIFLGAALAPLVIKPYIKVLTMSEVHAVIASGFATIAGNVFALYVSLGIDASFLLAASVMSAPAALACSKILYPETEETKTSGKNIGELAVNTNVGPEDHNIIDAAIKGAVEGAIMVRDIVAILIAMVAFMAFLNGTVSFFGGIVGHEEITFDWIIGKCFIPLAYIIGVQWSECETVGRLIGTKIVLNEFIAYRELGILAQTCQLSTRSIAIATYAMCSYANPGSLGVSLAVMSNLCPERRSDFTSVLFRAFFAAIVGCLLTACFAGALYKELEDNIPSCPRLI